MARLDMPDNARQRTGPPLRLIRHLASAYVLLIVYASLHPFSGWRDPGVSPFDFLVTHWPHYWTGFDIAVNVLAYLPLGFLIALSIRPGTQPGLPALLAVLAGTALSFGLETLQAWLPSRVPSNLDLASNAVGAALGAALAEWLGQRLLAVVERFQRWLAPIPHVDVTLMLVGLWLLTQLSPETLLFSAGDLRHLFDITPAVTYAPSSFFALETAIIVCNTVAIGLIVCSLLSPQRSPFRLLVAFFALAMGIRTLAAAILVGPTQALVWLTPGAGLGLMVGGALLSVLLLLPPRWRRALATLSLMAGTVLVNLAPPNPYSTVAMAAWQQGHFLNFNGLTRLIASLWPFLALPCLTLLGRRQ